MPKLWGLSLLLVFPLSGLFTNPCKMFTSNEAPVINLGPGLLRDTWLFAAVSIIIVLLRVVSKTRIRKFALDDVLVIFALVSNTIPYDTASWVL